jgi:hypothetical protein
MRITRGTWLACEAEIEYRKGCVKVHMMNSTYSESGT